MSQPLSAPTALRAQDRLIFALDVPDLSGAEALVRELSSEVTFFKVGLELFLREGRAAVDLVHSVGARCFLDLKLHDIPETVARAVDIAVATRVAFLTVHASGGPVMLRRAQDCAGETRLLAVTVLTSMDAVSLQAIGMSTVPGVAVNQLAATAWDAGVHGFVCSAHETAGLRAKYGPNATLVVPGIRPNGSEAGDQSRVATPKAAIANGADYLVVGRPIRDAKDRRRAACDVIAEIEEAML